MVAVSMIFESVHAAFACRGKFDDSALIFSVVALQWLVVGKV